MGVVSMSESELLKFAIENGMIDTALVQEKIEMQRRKELLEKHPYSIWEDKNGTWHTYLPNKSGRIPRKRKSREEIEDVIIEYWREFLYNPTVEEIFNEWNDRRVQLEKISPASQLRIQQIFNRHFKKFRNRRIKDITMIEWEEFLEEQIAEFHLTAKAFSGLKSIAKGILKRAKKLKLIEYNITELFDELDISNSDFRIVHKEDAQEVFSDDELPRVINYLLDNLDIWNLAILLMFVTGIRVGELVALKFKDFDTNPCGFYVKRTETRYKKDGKYVYDVKEAPKTQAGFRFSIIPQEYEWIFKKLAEINQDSEYAFYVNGHRMTTNSVRRRMERICKKLGFQQKSPHKARKTYGSILLDNHVDNNIVIGQMGHTSIMCTEKHYHRNRKSVLKKSDIISSLPEFNTTGTYN